MIHISYSARLIWYFLKTKKRIRWKDLHNIIRYSRLSTSWKDVRLIIITIIIMTTTKIVTVMNVTQYGVETSFLFVEYLNKYIRPMKFKCNNNIPSYLSFIILCLLLNVIITRDGRARTRSLNNSECLI